MGDAPRLEDLQQIEAAVWRELASAVGGVGGKGHPWRVAVLATTDGQTADARSVVLRELDADNRQLLIYTDARSPKAAQVAAFPQGTLVLWSPALGWQLRLRVSLGLQTAGLAVSSRWALLKLTPAAHDYLSPLPPGSSTATPGSPLDTPLVQREERGHFAVLTAQITHIDWLELHAAGHRRAMFSPQGARWVTP